MRAYELIGYDVPVARLVATRKRIQGVRSELMQQQQMFPADIAVFGRGGRTRNWLRLKNGMKISVRVCIRVAHLVRPAWYVRPVHRERRWTALVALMNSDNCGVEQLLVFRVPDSRRFLRNLRGPLGASAWKKLASFFAWLRKSRRHGDARRVTPRIRGGTVAGLWLPVICYEFRTKTSLCVSWVRIVESCSCWSIRL